MTALAHSHGNAAHHSDCGHCRTHALYVYRYRPWPAWAQGGAPPSCSSRPPPVCVAERHLLLTYLLAAPTHTRYTAAARVTLTRAPLVTTSLPHVPQVTTK